MIDYRHAHGSRHTAHRHLVTTLKVEDSRTSKTLGPSSSYVQHIKWPVEQQLKSSGNSTKINHKYKITLQNIENMSATIGEGSG